MARNSTIQLGAKIWRFGMFIFAREYFQYNSWYIIPGVSIDILKGIDLCIDVECKFLCVGVGVRFIIVKQKNKQDEEK